MMIRKYMSIIVSGGIALVLLVIAAFFLYRFHGHYSDVKVELKTANSNLDKLMSRKPYPSQQNIDIEKRNLAELEGQLAKVRDWMEEGQIGIEEWRNPTEFQIKLSPKLQALGKKGRDAVPDGFSFGFGKYAEGEMPSASDVARLSRQLQMIETLCEILFENRIENLSEVGRLEFDSERRRASVPSAVASGRRGGFGREPRAPADEKDTSMKEKTDDQGMYAWEEFTVDFQARERSFWSILHDLSNTNLLVSVEDLAIESSDETKPLKSVTRDRSAGSLGGADGFERNVPGSRTDRRGRTTTDSAADAEPEYLPREERVVAGEGLLNVTMTVNMYRFLDENTEGEAE